MSSRRTFVLTGLAGLLAGATVRRAGAAQPFPNDPVAIVNAIYARAARGKGDGGGTFMIEDGRQGKISVQIAGGFVGPGRCQHAEGRCPADRFRSRHQLARAGREIVQGRGGEAGDRQGGRDGYHHRPDAARQARDNTIRYNFVREDGKWNSMTSAAPSTAKPGRSAPSSASSLRNWPDQIRNSWKQMK